MQLFWFQILFDKKLSRFQWLSLILLSLGCVVKQLSFQDTNSLGLAFTFHSNLVLILVQVVCACFASVYNEYLLKGREGNVPFYVQNVFMYADSIVCNIAALHYTGSLNTAFTRTSMESIFQIKVLAVIVNNASIGIVTALFLRSLNSILKTFASAVEPMFTAILCWFIFGIPVNAFTFVAIAIVFYAIMLYSRNPVENTPSTEYGNKKQYGSFEKRSENDCSVV